MAKNCLIPACSAFAQALEKTQLGQCSESIPHAVRRGSEISLTMSPTCALLRIKEAGFG
jgi:hypothetical protein